jgi:hypothetical protein
MCKCDVDGATHAQKGDVQWWKLLERCCRHFCADPVRRSIGLRSSILTTFDLSEVDVTLKKSEIFRLVLSGEGGSADGWQCC